MLRKKEIEVDENKHKQGHIIISEKHDRQKDRETERQENWKVKIEQILREWTEGVSERERKGKGERQRDRKR